MNTIQDTNLNSIKKTYSNELNKLINTRNIKNFITLTSKNFHNVTHSLSHVNKLIHIMNSRMFSNNYGKLENVHLKGFVSYEQHSDGTPHFHLLIEDFSDIDLRKKDFEQVFNKSIYAVKYQTQYSENKYHVFNRDGVDFQTVYSDEISGYVMKDIEKFNYESYGFIGKDGVIGLY